MSIRFSVQLATGILFAAGRVSAEPEFSTFELNFSQAGTTNSLNVSMIFRAFSPTRYLALGGGFTVRCNQTTAGQIHAKNLAQRLGFGVLSPERGGARRRCRAHALLGSVVDRHLRISARRRSNRSLSVRAHSYNQRGLRRSGSR